MTKTCKNKQPHKFSKSIHQSYPRKCINCDFIEGSEPIFVSWWELLEPIKKLEFCYAYFSNSIELETMPEDKIYCMWLFEVKKSNLSSFERKFKYFVIKTDIKKSDIYKFYKFYNSLEISETNNIKPVNSDLEVSINKIINRIDSLEADILLIKRNTVEKIDSDIENGISENILLNEKDRIVFALNKNMQRRNLTAKMLGMSERTLFRKINKYGLNKKVKK